MQEPDETGTNSRQKEREREREREKSISEGRNELRPPLQVLTGQVQPHVGVGSEGGARDNEPGV